MTLLFEILMMLSTFAKTWYASEKKIAAPILTIFQSLFALYLSLQAEYFVISLMNVGTLLLAFVWLYKWSKE